MKEYNSRCCGSSVTVGGKGMTHYYLCNSCMSPCDIMADSSNDFVTLNGDYWCHSKHSCTLLNKDDTCGFKNGNCPFAIKRN